MNSGDQGYFSVCIMESVRKMLPSPVELVWLLSSLLGGFFGKGICDICVVAFAQHPTIAILYYGQTVCVCVNDRTWGSDSIL